MKIDVTTFDGKKGGSVDLNDAVFGQEPRKDILHRMVRYQLAKRQAGTHQVQERGDVAKTTKRIGNQKGGGTARHGNGSVSQFRGGAKAHGPRSRDHSHDLTKKFRRLALCHALSAKQSAGELIIVDTLVLKEAKTATLRKQLEDMGIKNALIVGGQEIDTTFGRAARNIPNIDVLPTQGANVYDILRRHTLVLSKDAVEALQERLK
jgi:large subunit ribosomal protein L4